MIITIMNNDGKVKSGLSEILNIKPITYTTLARSTSLEFGIKATGPFMFL